LKKKKKIFADRLNRLHNDSFTNKFNVTYHANGIINSNNNDEYALQNPLIEKRKAIQADTGNENNQDKTNMTNQEE